MTHQKSNIFFKLFVKIIFVIYKKMIILYFVI
jgi:hypothetical protein